MAEYNFDNICELIRKDFEMKPDKWHHIGYRRGRKVFCTESTLRVASVEQLCSDEELSPIRQSRKQAVPRRRPAVFDSLFFEILQWLWQSFWSIADGSVRS